MDLLDLLKAGSMIFSRNPARDLMMIDALKEDRQNKAAMANVFGPNAQPPVRTDAAKGMSLPNIPIGGLPQYQQKQELMAAPMFQELAAKQMFAPPKPPIELARGAQLRDPVTHALLASNDEPDKAPEETELAKYQRERQALAPNDPLRAFYDAKIDRIAKGEPKAPTAPLGLGEQYARQFGGQIPPNHIPEVGADGRLTGRTIPQPGSAADPAVVAAARKKQLEAELPEAKKSVVSVALPLQQLLSQIGEAKSDPNTRDVVGAWEGAKPGENKWRINPLTAQGNANAASRIDNIRNLAQTIGVQMTRNASKTGGAGGQVTVTEWPKFESQIANLDPTQDEATFEKQLTAAENAGKALLQAMTEEFKATYGVDPFGGAAANGTTSSLGDDVNALLDKYAPRGP